MDLTKSDSDVTVRRARPDDEAAVAAFTRETWSDRETTDYLPDVFARWVENDGDDQRTFVLDDAGDAVGVAQGTMLTDAEAWAQGLRVHPDYRGRGLSTALTDAIHEWARDRGASICRCMVFSWNAAGLGQSQSAGFRPCTEFRWAEPDPDPDATADPALDVGANPADAWSFWTGSDARTALRGLAMDAAESWAVSELRREQLRAAADDDRLFVASDGGTRGFTYRAYDYDRETGAGVETWGIYGVAAWDDPDAARALFRAVARDAADAGLDRTRILIPEGVGWIADAVAARTPIADEPDFVMAADLSDPSIA